MRFPRLWTLPVLLLACSGTPAGPGPGGGPPTGIIYFSYLRATVGDWEVWQVHPDGSNLGRVPHPFSSVLFPHVSLSGRWLAYSESGDIFLADLTNPPGWDELPQHDITFVGRRGYPLVSPSGRLVANTYMGPDPALWGVRISRNDQSGVETLLEPLGESVGEQQAIGWFPDEDSLLVREWGRQHKYFIVHTDGSGRREAGIPGMRDYLRVALSPTGRFIALSGGWSADTGDAASRTIAIHRMATGELVQVLELPDAISEVVWSPDERHIAYEPIDVAGAYELAVVELATGSRTVILDVPGLSGIRFPVWVESPPSPLH
jgi:Tol biopolymer transport system component